MKNIPNANLISSTLKTVASENLVTDGELNDHNDKPLEELLNEEIQKETDQKNQESTIIS